MTERARPRKGGGSVRPRGVRYAVKIVIDGRRLDLKEFLHDFIGGSVAGMLAGLRHVGSPKKIRIDVTRL